MGKGWEAEIWIPFTVKKALKSGKWTHMTLSYGDDDGFQWSIDGKEIKMTKRRLARIAKLKARKRKRKGRIQRRAK